MKGTGTNLRNGLRNTADKLDEAAVTASMTCTRSGAFAMLLSLALFTMIPYWLHREEQAELDKYVTLRLSLEGAIEMLDGSVNWQSYRASNPAAESMTIAQLLKVQVTGAKSPPVLGNTAAENTGKAGALRSGVPAPPTGLQVSIVSSIDEIPPIADLITRLDDSQLLTKSRNASLYYNYSIYRWIIKRNASMQRNFGASSGGVIWEAPPDPNAPPNSVYSVGKDFLQDYLTIKDVRELAVFELPQLSDNTRIGTGGEREIDIAPGSLPRTLFAATLCAESLLLFVCIYFGAFAREAVLSESFPVPGSVFSAFAKSGWTLLVLGIALCVPVVASLSILAVSRKWELACYSVLIGWVVFWIFGVLQRKHYFGDFGWKPRVFGLISTPKSRRGDS